MELEVMQFIIFILHLFFYHISFFLGNKYYCLLILVRNLQLAKIQVTEEFYQNNPQYKEKICLHLENARRDKTINVKSTRELKSNLKKKRCVKYNSFRQKIKKLTMALLHNLSSEEMKRVFTNKASTIKKYISIMKNRGLFALLCKPVYKKVPHNKKGIDVVRLLWDLHDRNPGDGRFKLSFKMALLGKFIAPSTVRNYLNQPRPNTPKRKNKKKKDDSSSSTGDKKINAKYPNHTWNVDFTSVNLFFTYVYVFFVIDIYSRKIIYFAVSRYNPTAYQTVQAMKRACSESWNAPKYLINDNGEQFRSAEFILFCDQYNIIQRFGKIYSWRSNAHIERFHQTIKYEALYNLVIFTMNYLTKMIKSFIEYYNDYRPHLSLNGLTPSMVYDGKKELPDPAGKEIKKIKFCDSLITGFFLDKAA